MNIGQKFGKQILATALVAGALAGSAEATVLSWAWRNDAGFLSWVSNPAATVVASGSTGAPLNLPTQLTWPLGGVSQSNIHTSGSQSGSGGTAAVTNGPVTFGVNLTHDNFPLSPSPPGDLTSAILRDKLWMSPNPGPVQIPPTTDPSIPALQFDIHFLETPNEGNGGGICADGTSRLLDPLNASGCADLFGVQDASAFVQTFSYDDGSGPQMYRITIAAAGLGPQSAGFCSAISLAPGCVGFRTPENQSTSLNPFFRIELLVAPEPGMLALLGAGLALLGFSRRRTG